MKHNIEAKLPKKKKKRGQKSMLLICKVMQGTKYFFKPTNFN